MSKTMDCMKCGGRMEMGFILDHAHSMMAQSHWVSGEAEQMQFLGLRWAGVTTRGKTVRTVDTYRCTRCGYLESYSVGEDDGTLGRSVGKKGEKR